MPFFQLIRIKDWAKNLFLFLPVFFAQEIFKWELYPALIQGFFSFSFVASSIYILNDYRDVKDDRKHPEKCRRPLASGSVSTAAALVVLGFLLIAGLGLAWLLGPKFLFVVVIYLILNIGYSFGLKTVPILDVLIVAIGFVLRVKGGAVLADLGLSEWLSIMVFLLALFMAIGKRRDDVLLKLQMGHDMRRSIKGYNLELLNVALALVCAVIVVAYFMYTMSPDVLSRMGTYRLYYTCLFVLAGILRYLQIIYVQATSGSPTKILYRDRFIQISLVLWMASFYFIIYMKDITLFK